MSEIARLARQVAELERRLANVTRIGKVAEVDAGKGLVRVEIARDPEGGPVLTPWLPWTERAGGIRSWSPPAEGEQVTITSPSGEIAQGWVSTGGFSSQYEQPSDKGDEHMLTIGDAVITVRGDAVTIALGDASIRLAGGSIVLDGEVHLGGEGGEPVHRKGDIDTGGDLAEGAASRVFAV